MDDFIRNVEWWMCMEMDRATVNGLTG